MASKVVRVKQKSPIKAGPEGGANIGVVWAGTVLVVEISNESPHDGWQHIVGPNPPINGDGTYLKTGKQGWIEVAHCGDIDEEVTEVSFKINWKEKSWTATEK